MKFVLRKIGRLWTRKSLLNSGKLESVLGLWTVQLMTNVNSVSKVRKISYGVVRENLGRRTCYTRR